MLEAPAELRLQQVRSVGEDAPAVSSGGWAVESAERVDQVLGNSWAAPVVDRLPIAPAFNQFGSAKFRQVLGNG